MGLAGGLATNGQSGGGGSSVAAVAFGTAAGRPAAAAGNANTAYFATDTKELTVSNGSAWSAIASTSAVNFQANNGGTTPVMIGLFSSQNGLFASGGQTASLLALSNTWYSGTTPFDTNSGFRVVEGSNAKQGTTGAMTAGSVTVANTSVTANSRIFVCRSAGGTNPGAWYVSAQTAGTSFVVTSTNASDTGNGVFQIFEPG